MKTNLTKVNQAKWVTNLKLFLIPVALMYIGQLIGYYSIDSHEFSLIDFIPSKLTQGGMILYVLNFIQDYLRKLQSA